MISRRKLVLCSVACAILIKNQDSYDFLEQKLILPVSRLLPTEVAHRCALWSVRLKIPPRDDHNMPRILRTYVFGMHFDNPIGLAAGFDKDCEAVKGLKRLGFGFIEVGSVTPLPQPGNNQPRLFRLPEDKAIINRFGFPSKGADAAASRLNKLPVKVSGLPVKVSELPKIKETPLFTLTIENKYLNALIFWVLKYRYGAINCKLGINLGINKNTKNPTNDYCVGINKLGMFSDYIVINVSSPNTPGLRDLQRKTELEKMMRHISNRVDRQQKASNNRACKALLLKISPDLSDDFLEEVLDVAKDSKFGVDGLIVSNTTVSRPDSLTSSNKHEVGGLSGAPLKDLSTEMIKKVYRMTDGNIPIIGVGGVSSAEDAYEKIRAGATLVQMYTGLVYNGWGSVRRMKVELCNLLEQDGYNNIQDAVGADVPDVENKTKNYHQYSKANTISTVALDLPPIPIPVDSSITSSMEDNGKLEDNDSSNVEDGAIPKGTESSDSHNDNDCVRDESLNYHQYSKATQTNLLPLDLPPIPIPVDNSVTSSMKDNGKLEDNDSSNVEDGAIPKGTETKSSDSQNDNDCVRD